MENKEKVSVSEKVASKITAGKTILVAVLVVAVVVIAGFAICSTVVSKGNKKGLTALDSISYTLTKDSAELFLLRRKRFLQYPELLKQVPDSSVLQYRE